MQSIFIFVILTFYLIGSLFVNISPIITVSMIIIVLSSLFYDTPQTTSTPKTAYKVTQKRKPTVHLLCGMICSGKSSLASHLSRRHNAIVYSPDAWLLYLHGKDFDVRDFSKYGDSVKELIWRQAQEVCVRYGQDVILDFSLWDTQDREYWRQRILGDATQWYEKTSKNTIYNETDEVISTSYSSSKVGGKGVNDDLSSTNDPFHKYEESVNTVYSSSVLTIVDKQLEEKCCEKYTSKYSNEHVRIILYYLDTPLGVCRERLKYRNTKVLSGEWHNKSCHVPGVTSDKDDENPFPDIIFESDDSECQYECPSSPIYSPKLPSHPYIHNNKDSCKYNFVIQLEDFDDWTQYLQPPSNDEFPIVINYQSIS